MLAQKIAQQSLRRLATQSNAYRFTAPAAATVTKGLSGQQKRLSTTSPSSPQSLLARQRLNRPIAPHLSIYRPQITWYLSGLNRITGCTVSGLFYSYGALYLIAPYLGWHLESAVLAASFGSWPVLAQVVTKFSLAMPFVFHCLNGMRHLVWDTTSMMTNAKVSRSGWVVVGLTGVGSLGLACL